jgi:hypothetical protein
MPLSAIPESKHIFFAPFSKQQGYPKSAIEKFGRDFYAFWASQGIAQGILPLLLRQTGIHA